MPSACAAFHKLCSRSRLLELRQPCLDLFFSDKMKNSASFPSLTLEGRWGSRGDRLCFSLPIPSYKPMGFALFIETNRQNFKHWKQHSSKLLFIYGPLRKQIERGKGYEITSVCFSCPVGFLLVGTLVFCSVLIWQWAEETRIHLAVAGKSLRALYCVYAQLKW